MKRLALWSILFTLYTVVCCYNGCGFRSLRCLNTKRVNNRHLPVRMAMDEFITAKLNSVVRNFDALTERLADPDVANDRKQTLTLSRERSSIEKTVDIYHQWKALDAERIALIEMEQFGDSEQDLKELIRNDLRELIAKQSELEKQIMVLLLPRDPNDDRNVMLEIRSGTGGDEASIWAGDLVNIYRKYSEAQGWKVVPITESEGEMGGYKTCILQVSGDYVYSKLKYEVKSSIIWS